MRRLAVVVTALLGVLMLHQAQPAFADDAACTNFNWPLETEIGWMAAADSEVIPSGGTISGVPAKAVTLAMQPSDKLELAVVSGVKKQAVGPNKFSGWFKIANVEKAGLYQVSLSREGWIDVVQAGKLLDSTAFTGRRECSLLRKSVRYELPAGETLIQIVGAPADTIKITVKAAN